MPRCDYHSGYFQVAAKAYGVFSGDGGAQCWMTDTAVFSLGAHRKAHYCLFHAPASIDHPRWPLNTRTRLQTEKLNEMLDAWAEEARTRIEQAQPVTDFVLPGAQADWLVFGPPLSAGQLVLADSTFAGPVDLQYFSCDTEMIFHNAKINGRLNVNEITGHGTLDLTGAEIANGARIYKSFLGSLALNDACFGRDFLLLGGALGFLGIEGTTFQGVSLIADVPISDAIYLSHSGKRLQFQGGDFGKSSDHRDSAGQTLEFTNTDCSLLSFVNCNLSKVDFSDSDVRDTRFESCVWARDETGRLPYSKTSHHDQHMKSDDDGTLRVLKAHYRLLKKNFEESLDYQQAGDFHFREMEVRQALAKRNRDWPEWFVLWAYRLVADFGESYKKLLISLMLSFPVAAASISGIEAYHRAHFYRSASRLGHLFLRELGNIFFGILPTAVQRTVDIQALWWPSRVIVVIEAITVATLGTLFVMAIRRRFRR